MGTARSTLRTTVKSRGRIGANVADTTVNAYLNAAAKQFQKDTKLLVRPYAFNVRSKFTIGTGDAFSLTMGTTGGSYVVNATDVVLATAQTDVSGATLASAFQTIIQGTTVGATATTVSFSESTRKFTIDASAESATVNSWTIAYPGSASYSDDSYLLFGDATSEADDDFAGAPAPYCTSEYKLPTDFYWIEELVYDGKEDRPLKAEIRRGRSHLTGIPSHYSVNTKYNPATSAEGWQYMTVTPQPTTAGKRFDLLYNPHARTIDDGSTGDAQVYEFNAVYDEALIYYSVYLAKLDAEEMQDALTFKGLYEMKVDEGVQDRSMRIGQALDSFERGRRGL